MLAYEQIDINCALDIINDKIAGKLIDDFIKYQINDMEESGWDALMYCELENDYHITSYWPDSIYQEVGEFIIKHNKEGYLDSLYSEILDRYSKINSISKLEDKVRENFKAGNYKSYLAYEALSSIILKEFQKLKVWYTVYGCEEEDAYDFNRYHILNALEDHEEFPVMKMSDISASMLGLNTTAQPSDLYDVFAHYADELTVKDNTIFSDDSPIFTPDPFQYDAVVGRYKWFLEDIDKSKKKVDNLSFNIEPEDPAVSSLNKLGEAFPQFKDFGTLYKHNKAVERIRELYLYKYGQPPYSFPLTDKNLITEAVMENDELRCRIRFNIMGICNKETVWKEVFNKVYDIPDEVDVNDFVVNLAIDIKREIAGLEKDKKGNDAIEGLYPRKNLATHGLKLSNIPLYLAEKQSTFIIKRVLRHVNNPESSCSWGVDSVVTLFLIRRVTKKDFEIVFNNTRVEYAETIALKNRLTEEWNLKDQVIEAFPDTTYWKFQEEYGWNFDSKGSRSVNANGKKVSTSEICCKLLKHEPFKRKIKERGYNCCFSGLRASESMARDLAGKRDGIAYTSKDWGLIRVNPILFFTNEMVWEFVKKYNVPYSKIYDMVLYDDDGNVLYVPRTGCWPCLISKLVKSGYLKWLKHFKPKQYWYLMKDKKLAETLYRLSLGLKEKKPSSNCQVSFLEEPSSDDGFDQMMNDSEIPWEQLEYLLETRPCQFEKGLM